MAKARQHGWYCSSCGRRHDRLPEGLVNCAGCGAIGLRGYALIPRRVKCSAPGCTFEGWNDGGVNDDLGDHYRKAHAEDRRDLAEALRILRLTGYAHDDGTPYVYTLPEFLEARGALFARHPGRWLAREVQDGAETLGYCTHDQAAPHPCWSCECSRWEPAPAKKTAPCMCWEGCNDREGKPPCEHEAAPGTFDLVAHIERARAFSRKTFGPGARTAGVIAHIRKELAEIEQAPSDITEWIDVVILALDGAWRAGHEPAEIVRALEAKQTRNEQRKWPDWRTASEGHPIEHISEGAAPGGEKP